MTASRASGLRRDAHGAFDDGPNVGAAARLFQSSPTLVCVAAETIWLVRSGHLTVRVDKAVQELNPGDLLVIRARQDLLVTASASALVISASFGTAFTMTQLQWARLAWIGNPDEIRRAMDDLTTGIALLRPGMQHQQAIESDLVRLLLVSRTGGPLTDRLALASRLLWTAFDALSTTPLAFGGPLNLVGQQYVRREVRTALLLLEERFVEPWSTASMGRAVSVSGSALQRAFRQDIGLTLTKYLHVVRLAQFEQLLLNSDLTIAQAGRSVGWKSTAFARRAFQEHFGHSPREHRRGRRAPET